MRSNWSLLRKQKNYVFLSFFFLFKHGWGKFSGRHTHELQPHILPQALIMHGAGAKAVISQRGQRAPRDRPPKSNFHLPTGHTLSKERLPGLFCLVRFLYQCVYNIVIANLRVWRRCHITIFQPLPAGTSPALALFELPPLPPVSACCS